MKLTKVNGRWKMDFTVHGHRHRITAGGTRKEVLKLMKEAAHEAGHSVPHRAFREGDPNARIYHAIGGWRDFLYLRRRSPFYVEKAVGWIKAWARDTANEDTLISSIGLKDIDVWINRPGKNKARSRDIALGALRCFFEFCRDSGWSRGNPAKLVCVDMSVLTHGQKETLKRPCFTEEEVNMLLRATDKFWHAAIAIGRYTGLRLGDIACLEWECFDFPNNKMAVWTQKMDKRVYLEIHPRVRTVLTELDANDRSKTPSRYVFPEQQERYNPKRAPVMSAQFAAIIHKLGLDPQKTFHSLRATYVTDCMARGIPLEHIAVDVGHSNPWTTRGYVRPIVQKSIAAAELEL